MDEADYNRFKKYDIGDIVGVRGEVFRTQRGEMSVRGFRGSSVAMRMYMSMSRVLWWVIKGRAVAPPEMVFSTQRRHRGRAGRGVPHPAGGDERPRPGDHPAEQIPASFQP